MSAVGEGRQWRLLSAQSAALGLHKAEAFIAFLLGFTNKAKSSVIHTQSSTALQYREQMQHLTSYAELNDLPEVS